MQTIDLDYDKQDFYCPFTGVKIFSEDGVHKSDSLLFSYVDVAGDFEYIDESLTNIRDEFFDDMDEDEPLEKFIKKVDETIDGQLIIINLTSYGIACGPVSCTVTLGLVVKPE